MMPSATIKQFPPITKQRALAIVARALTTHSGQFKCYSQRPDSCRIYLTCTDVPCWYVYAPWRDGLFALRSSRIIVISRLTSKVLYDGSAGDEG
ncbi:MAG: hypothetical protein Q8R84_10915 [Candidatus Nitrotoga sp.]|nr:hypothetical protein [Candidatus Nitrotoga sp.]